MAAGRTWAYPALSYIWLGEKGEEGLGKEDLNEKHISWEK